VILYQFYWSIFDIL